MGLITAIKTDIKALILFGFIGLFSMTAVAAVPNQEAYDLVESKTDELVKLISDNRQQYLKDEKKFFADIDQLLSPVVDFKRIARRVMAKYYKRASAEERKEFAVAFKRSLMKAYAKGLLDYDNQKVEVLPPRGSARPSSKKQKVDMEFYGNGGKTYPISYSMFLDKKTGTWKIENIVVNGINLGLTYRNQFARLMKENKNDIGEVVAQWTAQVDSSE